MTISDIKRLYTKQGLGKTIYTYFRFWEYPRLVRIEALLTGSMLYLGDRFYYRSKKDMISFLSRFPLTVEVKNVSNFLMPYPELVYICKKK